jgi:hypothetical protein
MSNYQNGQKEGRITTCDEKEKREDKTGKKKKNWSMLENICNSRTQKTA